MHELLGKEQFFIHWKLYMCLLNQNTWVIMLLLNSYVHKKTTERQDRRNFESERALFVICASLCTCVTTLHLWECIRFQPIRSAQFFLCTEKLSVGNKWLFSRGTWIVWSWRAFFKSLVTKRKTKKFECIQIR